MPRSDFAPVWDRLPLPLRSALVRHPSRELTADDVDHLARAGAHDAQALWFETRPGRRRQWRTSWAFQQFVEQVRDAEPADRGRVRPWSPPRLTPDRR